MGRSNKDRSVNRAEQLFSRVDIELTSTECLLVCPCPADGVKFTELQQFLAPAKETANQRRDRKLKITEATQRGSVLPIDVGITAGYVRFVMIEMNEEENTSWIGKAISVLNAASGFITVQDHVLQVPAGIYQANIFCYLPNRSAVERLSSTTANWEVSASLADNLKTYWKSTRRYKCPWTNMNLPKIGRQ